MISPPTYAADFELASVKQTSSLATAFPPELIAGIPNHIPIVHRPAALLSLALTCRNLCNVIIPNLLYRAVWLETEKRALNILQRFNKQLSQGAPHSRYIRHVAIACGRADKSEPNVLQELHALVCSGGLPNLVAFTLHLGAGWHNECDDESREDWHGFGETCRPFWDGMAQNCPSVTRIHMTGIQDYPDPRWTEPTTNECTATDDGGVFNFKTIKSLRIMDADASVPVMLNQFNTTGFESSLEVLELPVPTRFDLLMTAHFSSLRTLILEERAVQNEIFIPEFWERHSKLERIELGSYVTGDGGLSEMSPSWLPNLQTLKCTFLFAKAVLPHVHSQLINLAITDTVNAQALYLLRSITPTGTMAQLRSLGIQLESSRRLNESRMEGSTWYEDSEGHTSDRRPAMRYFDANYLAILSKAVPNLEELELIGHSDGGISGLTSSLQCFRRLHTLVISGAASELIPPFFRSSMHWKEYADGGAQCDRLGAYRPMSLQDAMFGLGNGCRTLEQIRLGTYLGQLINNHDFTVMICRDGNRGPVRELRIKKGWGRLIGREDEW